MQMRSSFETRNLKINRLINSLNIISTRIYDAICHLGSIENASFMNKKNASWVDLIIKDSAKLNTDNEKIEELKM